MRKVPKKSTKKTVRRSSKQIERKALRIAQPSGTDLFLLTLSGHELLEIAGISRVSRDDDGRLLGYQRAEVRKHVREISEYLQSPGMILAHPIILSFNSSVRFVSSRGAKTSDGLAVAGTLEIPVPKGDSAKPAWIVDGQQRALAISLCAEKDFAVPVCAFIADDVELQRDQFLRINNSRPLPRGLVTELLPEVSTNLPANLAMKKIPAALCDLLNRDDASPFKGLIRRSSTEAAQKKTCVVTDTVVIKMLEESLTQASGCFFPYRNIATGECNHNAIWHLLVSYWTAVKETFPDAWGLSPSRSRLMHGVGIRSMGKLMDRIISSGNGLHNNAIKEFKRELALVAPSCRWTSGNWEELGGIRFDDIQNVPKHLSVLANYLVRKYLEKSSHR
ncbi:MAG: DGQHR domain-containing protein [Verrucomicrobia bacterium]|nr:DGQHR domain-containing protein [Verrucomicrobiota bacterium]